MAEIGSLYRSLSRWAEKHSVGGKGAETRDIPDTGGEDPQSIPHVSVHLVTVLSTNSSRAIWAAGSDKWISPTGSACERRRAHLEPSLTATRLQLQSEDTPQPNRSRLEVSP